MNSHTNWAGNVTFGARALHRPASVAELSSLVAGSARVRALGTGHSFNEIADTTGDLISAEGLPRMVEVDSERATVTISAGLRYGEVTGVIDEHGFALPNLGSLPHMTASFGVAVLPQHAGNAEVLLRRADRAGYLAKERGRNRVELAIDADVSAAVGVVDAGTPVEQGQSAPA